MVVCTDTLLERLIDEFCKRLSNIDGLKIRQIRCYTSHSEVPYRNSLLYAGKDHNRYSWSNRDYYQHSNEVS